MADALCAEYGWGLEYVLDEIPLRMAFALLEQARRRNSTGEERGMTYWDDEEAPALADALAAALAARKPALRPSRKRRALA